MPGRPLQDVNTKFRQKVVVAVPVAAAETADKLLPEVDDFVVLYILEWLGAIGAFYQCFDQVSDHEVVALMKSMTALKIA